MDPARDEHWQARWAERGLAVARRDPARQKFYALMAYPGSSGFLHVGHLRGLAYTDALHRFHRMHGRAVFFPTGTHASGLPSVTFAQRVREKDPVVLAQLADQGVDPAVWPTLEEPTAAARFLGASYLEAFRRFGLLIDTTAYVTTIDDDYQAFIRWQFRTLERLGALVQRPHYASVCPVCGPVSVDPSETDLSSGGDAEWITYTTVPFALDDGRVVLAATLRPETIYGVTNLWLHPTEPLVAWHRGETTFVVGHAAAPRLVEQHGGRIGHPVPAEHLLGRSVRVPLTDRSVPIVPSPLVAPGVGTGVVMSVPAHAPADWVARAALPPDVRASLPAPLVIIGLAEGVALTVSESALGAGEGAPAERAARAAGARTLDDREAIDEATQRLYRLELAKGVLRVEGPSPEPVAAARDRIRTEVHRLPGGFELREFSKPVICRNGHEVVIRLVPDQWFIHYGDPAWKTKVRALVAGMRFAPAEYGAELAGILDWLDDRPCTRRGRWLGTPFPADPTWIIEPIADSTFYPAYFVVRRFVHARRLPIAGLTDAFFDYVFRGEGTGEPTVDRALQDEIRDEFAFWYPLDLNVGGKEHKRVHFPVYLATHALLLPPELQPRGILVYWWLTDAGGAKLSKKRLLTKGGAIPSVREACAMWGADALRLFYFQAASPFQDVEWSTDAVDTVVTRLAEIERLASDALAGSDEGPAELDRWLEAAWHELLRDLEAAYDALELRTAAELTYARAPALVRRYLLRGGRPGRALATVADAWVRLLSPITPHLAEELGRQGGPTLVAERPWPTPEAFAHHPAALAAEAYLERVEDDLRNVVKLAEGRHERPRAVDFYIADPWKRTVEEWVREATAGGAPMPPIREFLARAEGHPDLASARSAIGEYLARIARDVRSAPVQAPTSFDEVAVLRSATGYLAGRFGLERVGVHPEATAEADDPANRRGRARPGRPAFYLTVPGREHAG